MKNIENFKKFLNENNDFILCGHESPDADSICSCIALDFLVGYLGKNVFCINSDDVPNNLTILDYKHRIHSFARDDLPDKLENYSLLVVDTNDIDNIGILSSYLMHKVKNIFVIDHHSFQIVGHDKYIIEPDSSSTCEIIYSMYKELSIAIPKEVGDALYAGILFDTGSFNYPKTSAKTLRIASEIVENGTNPNEIYLLLFEHETVESLKIMSLVMSTLELYYDEQIAVISLTKDMLNKSGAEYDDASFFINIPLKSHKIKAVIFYKEKPDGKRRVSMRSKDNIDVAKLSFKYGGGGHKNAAGFKFKSKSLMFANIKKDIIIEIAKQIKKNSLNNPNACH